MVTCLAMNCQACSAATTKFSPWFQSAFNPPIKKLELKLRSPFEGRRRYKGVLKGTEGEDVVVQVDDHEFLLPHGAIEKARVEPRA